MVPQPVTDFQGYGELVWFRILQLECPWPLALAYVEHLSTAPGAWYRLGPVLERRFRDRRYNSGMHFANVVCHRLECRKYVDCEMWTFTRPTWPSWRQCFCLREIFWPGFSKQPRSLPKSRLCFALVSLLSWICAQARIRASRQARSNTISG
jgi:hypothetical protein